MVGKNTLSTVATFSKVLCVNYHRFPGQSQKVVIIIPHGFSYALWRSQFTLLYGKVRKSEMRGSPQNVLYLHFNHKRLDFSHQNIYDKGTKFSVCLAVSPLVVRRTFYSIFKDRVLALKIRLLFSIDLQLLVVDYIIQLIVVNVNDFLQKFK